MAMEPADSQRPVIDGKGVPCGVRPGASAADADGTAVAVDVTEAVAAGLWDADDEGCGDRVGADVPQDAAMTAVPMRTHPRARMVAIPNVVPGPAGPALATL